jgi:PKD repeat protein
VNPIPTAYVGQNITFDASKSVDYGIIVSYDWSFGDGANGSGAVVSHSYDKEGTYQVELNVTNNDGISNFETLTITVENLPGYLLLEIFLAIVLSLLILMFAFLLRNRRKEPAP